MRPQSAQVIDLEEYRQQRRVARSERALENDTMTSGSSLTMPVALWWFPVWTWMPVWQLR
ncbi:hypothetical protein BE04_09165 [Sorangium cellulosum]|uniref:Uncharacterized protein n=2 Tax=Sorangium cellulosum TaxID=56 RepID=A0A150S237_SORCE|nr:hypothetical protein SCE1572_38560 [Sorangium cellulosum So0157-2]KYF53378.1 hypothetical protein BE04_09165 [Sorangium cellulosum]KYF81203.1 hypothetical protein BE18_06240 [Sorangium cellulosum]KYF86519.1 hypothetical protein BE20_28900 [Sorangium cellulosum]KYG10712.1 hypothetical protein BE21_10310 [Sorangium cellulosum]